MSDQVNTPTVQTPSPNAVVPFVPRDPVESKPRNNTTIVFTEKQYTKKGDRKGQTYWSPDENYFDVEHPENLNALQEHMGTEWWNKVLSALFRTKCQTLDSICTNKGKEPLDMEEFLTYFAEQSTRGEPIGAKKQLLCLLTSWFTTLSDLDVNDVTLRETFEAINNAAKAEFEAAKEDDDESDPVLIDKEYLDRALAFYNDVVKSINDPKYNAFSKEDKAMFIENIKSAASSKTFKAIGGMMKELDTWIKDNTKKRKPRGANKSEETTEVVAK